MWVVAAITLMIAGVVAMRKRWYVAATPLFMVSAAATAAATATSSPGTVLAVTGIVAVAVLLVLGVVAANKRDGVMERLNGR